MPDVTTPIPNPTAAPTAPAGSNAAVDLLLGSAGLGTLGAYVGAGSSDDRPVPSLTGLGKQGWGVTDDSLTGFSSGLGATGKTGAVGEFTTDRVSTRSAAAVAADVVRMTDPELEQLSARLVAAGLLDPSRQSSRTDIEAAWQGLVDKAATYHSANPTTNLTPEDMIDLYGNGGTPANPKVTDVVNKQVNIASADQARSLLESMMSDALGRAPSLHEADSFQAALNDAQSKSPAVTTTNTTYDASGSPTTTSTATGGIDTGQFTKDYIKDQDHNEYRSYQAATTYYNALLQALRGPADLTQVQ